MRFNGGVLYLSDKHSGGTKRILIRSPIYFAYIFLILWTILQLFPLIWMLYSSLKSNPDIFSNRFAPPFLPTQIHPENYIVAWTGGFENVTTGLYLTNSIIVSSISIIFLVFISVLAGYSIARLKPKGSNFIFYFFLIMIAIPPAALLVPIYTEIRLFGLVNQYLGLILPYIGLSLPFSIVVARSFFMSFPREFEEAAKIDGCSEVATFRWIILPLSRGILAMLAIVNFPGIWNELLFALVIMQSNSMKTLGPGLMGFVGQYVTLYNYLFAGLDIAVIPLIIFYMIFQKQIVKGVLAGSIKG